MNQLLLCLLTDYCTCINLLISHCHCHGFLFELDEQTHCTTRSHGTKLHILVSKLHRRTFKTMHGGGSRGRVQGMHTPPPPTEMKLSSSYIGIHF